MCVCHCACVCSIFKMPSRAETDVPVTYTQEEFDQRRDHWYRESPVYKTKNQLREYQIEGLNFLIKAWYDDRNTILADEMVSTRHIFVVRIQRMSVISSHFAALLHFVLLFARVWVRPCRWWRCWSI